MGLDLKPFARRFSIVAALAVFIGLPLLIYALGDTPRRSVLKESISLLTLLALSMMLGQFFLARSNAALLSLFEPPQIQTVHKVIAYPAVGVILLHPYLVVLTRHFETGVMPWDAFVTMLRAFDRLGILLGLVAWFLLLVLSVTAVFRKPLIKRFSSHYRGWRHLHGGLAVTFTVLALWHAVELGRHTGVAMSAVIIELAFIGIAMLARLYWTAQPNRPRTSAEQQRTQSRPKQPRPAQSATSSSAST